MSPAAELAATGRTWLRGTMPAADLADLSAHIAADHPGQRTDTLPMPSRFLDAIARHWPDHAPVRTVAFSKSPTANWAVPWHQDRVIAVAGRTDTPGYHNWSCKAGQWHCEPPEDVLAGMLFVRLHLDANTVENGAMEVALGSHRRGLIASADAACIAEDHPVEVCAAAPGDVQVLAMLTLHRSAPSRNDAPRRALRVDFSNKELSTPLRWAAQPQT